MSWTAPMTAVAGSVFTAAQFNTFVRDNLLECPAAKATSPGSHFTTSATNQVTERIVQSAVVLGSAETTTSTSYADLTTPGPAVTVTTTSYALVLISGSVQNDTSGQSVRMAYDISGATSSAAADNRGIGHFAAVAGTCGMVAGNAIWESTLTPGSNTFTCKYRVAGGTGTFQSRRLQVIPF